MNARKSFHYCAYFCEENVWKLCQEAEFQDREARVLFISNPSKTCAVWHQRAAPSPQEPVVWDYHVVFCAKNDEGHWEIWDLDTTLDFPMKAPQWLLPTFAMDYVIPEEYRPWFRVLEVEEFLENFSSDRSHMLDEKGDWRAGPPEWEAPFQEDRGMNLMRFVEMKEEFAGEVMDLSSLWEFLTSQ